jgi:hypothetical protein
VEGGFVRIYSAPILWLTVSALLLALQVYQASTRFRLRLTSDKLTAVQETYNPYRRHVLTIGFLIAGLFCTYATIRTLIIGVDTSWMWFLAAAALFAIPPAHRRAGVKLGAVDVWPDVATQHRRRRALWFGATAEVCFFAWQQTSNYAAQYHNILVRVISVVLLVAMLAAAWAAFRVYKDRAPDESSPPPHA